MRSKRSIRVRTRNPRTQNLENKIILAATVTLSVLFVFVIFSLGSRTNESEGSFSAKFNHLRERVKGWEAPVSTVSTTESSDARNNSGYHFLWTKKFHQPEWSLISDKKERPEQIQGTLKLGKARFDLIPSVERAELFQLRENLSKNALTIAEKQILPMLPGEKLSVHVSNATPAKPWKVRLRALAATQDRLDAPLRMLYGFEHLEKSVLEINPRGQVVDLELPSGNEFIRQGGRKFVIEWPTDASGLLSVEGFQPQTSDPDNRKPAAVRTLIVHIDSLDGSLKSLALTLGALKKHAASNSSQLHLADVVPPSIDFSLSQKAFLTGRYPLELGATLSNSRLAQTLTFEPLLLRKHIERGGAVRRLSFHPPLTQCPSACDQYASDDPWKGYFSNTLTIERRQEFASAASLLRNDEFMSEPGSVFVDFRFPAENLRLNWTTPLESEQSLLRWSVGGLMHSIGRSVTNLKEAEKRAQVDAILAKVIETFLANSNHANIAIFLHKNNAKESSNSNVSNINGLVRGEAIFNIFNFQISDMKDSEITEFNDSLSMMSAYKIFEKLTQSTERSGELSTLLAGMDAENSPITQLSDNEILTVTSEGWLMDPVKTEDQVVSRPSFWASPEHIHSVQEKSNAERRKMRLHGLNVLFPNRNDKDELVGVNLTTNLRLVACESANENAQADLRESNAQSEPGTMKNYRVVGRRSAQSAWHIHCLLEGRISTASRLRIVPSLNETAVAREQIGLGEFALPIRGFLWRSPDTLELTGAQILDATLAVKPADNDAARQTSAVIWTDQVPHGLNSARAVFAFADKGNDDDEAGAERPTVIPSDRLSGK